MPTLKDYNKKRSFDETPEPPPVVRLSKKKKSMPLIFVIQKHAATRLHYDFRLEVNGTLKSWAVPKGPSLNPQDKRLAIMVEDHPYDYKDFEGIIPKGNYGAGTVMVWDSGVYYPLDAKYQPTDEQGMEEGIKKGKIAFYLEGKKVKGIFSLVRIKSKDENQDTWLLIKGKDDHISTRNVLEEDKSAITERSMDEIGEKKSLEVEDPDERPGKIVPMLAYQADEPFDNPDWIFENKWDGFRAIADLKGEKVLLYSRSLNAFNFRYPQLIEALKKLNLDAIFDGEIVALKEGKPSFQALQDYQSYQGELCYYIFDLIYLKGKDLRNQTLFKRKELLHQIMEKKQSDQIKLSAFVRGEGIKAFAEAEEEGSEGIVAKRGSSTYSSVRSKAWLKIKTHNRQEAIICGFTEPRGGRKKFGALLLGVYVNNTLEFSGHVGTGFDERTLGQVYEKMVPLITEKCPFAKKPKSKTKVTWLTPKLLCEVSFYEWTHEHIMRHAVFLGLREDKPAKEVKIEKAQPISIKAESKEKTSKKEVKGKSKANGGFTNLDKIYWSQEGYTKGELIHYYEEVAPLILPYLKDRPQTLHRFPHGIDQPGFYQKNIDENFPDWVPTFPVNHKGNIRNYLLIPDKKTLLYAINLGCIDLNPFFSRIQALEYPDYMVLDLDPEDIAFDSVVETALTVHEVLNSFDIPSYCKTSGGRGIHVFVPMGAKYTYEQTKQFAELLAHFIHNRIPEITSLERSPSKRQKKVYIDFLQNNFGQTIAAPYSVRPRRGATVSTPLEWSEVKKGILPTDFTLKNAMQRFKKKNDFFKPILGKGINLSKILKHPAFNS